MTLEELNALELDFLLVLNFDLSARAAEFAQMAARLFDFAEEQGAAPRRKASFAPRRKASCAGLEAIGPLGLPASASMQRLSACDDAARATDAPGVGEEGPAGMKGAAVGAVQKGSSGRSGVRWQQSRRASRVSPAPDGPGSAEP